VIQRLSGNWSFGFQSECVGLNKSLAAMTFPGCQTEKCSHENLQLGVTGFDPFLFQDETLILMFDGSIFNPESLPSGNTIFEQIAHGYRSYGFVKLLQILNGDFAIALYDKVKRKIWLGRDRFGVRPLYYYWKQAEKLIFASQPAGIIAFPGIPRNPDPRYVAMMAASHYRYFDNVPESSPMLEIKQIPAAHWVSCDEDQLQIGSYWKLEDAPEWDGSEAELALRYRELLMDAVLSRLKQAKSPAFTLSGGMDSSSVLSCAVKGSNHKQIAYSSVYADQTYDESEDIQTILSETVSKWNSVLIEPHDVLQLVDEMVSVHHEPVATATWLSHFLVSRQAHGDGIKTLFGGLGGDELNIGEYEYFFYFFADIWQNDSIKWKNEVFHWSQLHNHPLYAKNEVVAKNAYERLAGPNGLNYPDRSRIERYAKLLQPGFFDLETYQPIMNHPFKNHLKNRTWQDIFHETMPCCLRAQDRHGARWGIEHFNPFLDYRLVEFMFRVPAHLKIRDGVTKILLRSAMEGIVPDTTRLRVKKTGWNAPAHIWFSGKMIENLLDMIHSDNFRQRGIYNIAELEKIILEHSEIVTNHKLQENHMMLLWQMVNLDSWFRYLEKI
jgi:asparagine synthase (glutamine-hydrolysing)